MKCHYHEDRESTNNCAICGKPICAECGMEIGGNILCKECVNTLISDSLSQKVSQKVPAQSQEVIEEAPARQTVPEPIEETPITQTTPQQVEQPQTIQRTPQQVEQPQTMQRTPQQVEQAQTIQSAPQQVEQAQTIQNENAIRQESPSIYTAENTHFDEQHALEDKYEKYLDDLYFDEPEKHELSLKEQLALDKDLEEIAPLPTPETYEEEIPTRRPREWVPEEERKTSASRRRQFHRVPKRNRNKKEPFDTVDILLTIVLIILILLVVFYIIYLFVLSASYPTFIDALTGLFTDPGKLFGSLFGSPV